MTMRRQSGSEVAVGDRVDFSRRMDATAQDREDEDTARLVTRFQAGDREAFAALYERYFERVYAYLHVAFRRRHEAEDATQQVFTQVFEKLHTYQRRSQPFRAWLFRVVRNYALRQLELQERVEPVDPAELDRRREVAAGPHSPLESLDWINDKDLLVFFERLPLAQRQALLLRFMLDMPSDEAAAVMGRDASDVRTLQHRAIAFLRQRLSAVRAAQEAPVEIKRRDRTARRQVRLAPVMRARRYSLTKRPR
jgi:RNA polymerase sigma-70 factor (ECF subfamily)